MVLTALTKHARAYVFIRAHMAGVRQSLDRRSRPVCTPLNPLAARQIATYSGERITSITICARNFKAAAKFIGAQ